LFALTLAARPAPALVITEIMYNLPEVGEDEWRQEFIEIFNENPGPLDLSGYFFCGGISFTFPEYTFLEGYQFLVICADEKYIRDTYEIENTIGDWDQVTALDNSGEEVAICNPSGARVVRVRYNDRGRWPAGADGTGHSLSLRYAYTEVDDPDSWAISMEKGGTPGRSNFGLENVGDISTNPGVDMEGFITNWLLLGPYGDNDLCEGSDRNLDWLAGGGVYEDDLYWEENQRVNTEYGTRSVADRLHPNGGTVPIIRKFNSFSGAVDLNAFWNNPDYVMAYAMVYVDNVTQDPINVDVGVASDAGIAVLFNGEYIIDVGACRALAPGVVDRGQAVLDVGKNLIMAKVFEGGGGWGFRLRLEERGSGVPITSDRVIRIYTDFNEGLDFGEKGPPLGDPPPDPVMEPGEIFPVIFNEGLTATSGGKWVELYNRSEDPVDLSGYFLTDDRLNLAKALLPDGTVVPGRGWLTLGDAALGLDFTPDGPVPGGRTFVALVAPGGEQVVDAYFFEPDEEEMSEARFPDGANRISEAATPTPGAANEVPVEENVVINEIMYHPIDEDPRREYIEIYNRGDVDVDLTGWRFSDGINFEFPSGSSIGKDGYLVVARDPAFIRQTYNLPASRVVGPQQDPASLDAFGVLRDKGERITLRDSRGNVADTVRTHDGGEWPRWPDGGGSSLELVDPWADNSNPQAWDSSDDSQKAKVDSFTYTGPFNGGEYEFQVALLGRGITLIDDIEMIGGDTTRIVEEEVLVEEGDLWRYRKGTSEPPANWNEMAFDDTGRPDWRSGATGIGYGDGDDDPDVAADLADMSINYLSVHCRRIFNVPPGLAMDRLYLQMDYDDGFVAYLNGTEIARGSLSGNPPEFDRAASSHEAGNPELFDVTDHKNLLSVGPNLLAVQVHNTNLGSSDLSMIPRLFSARVEEIPGGVNFLPNGGFESSTSGWKIEGNHIYSGRTTESPISGNGSLKLIATGRGDNKVNRIERDVPTLDPGTTYTIKIKGRWVVGAQSFITRGYNHSYPKNHQLSVPKNVGTPGEVNSSTLRRADGGFINIGPVIWKPVQDPVVPGDDEAVKIAARVDDPDGVTRVAIRYAINDPGAFAEVIMTDPDGDGIYRGTIPGQTLDTKVVFYLTATDAAGKRGRFPVDRMERTHPTLLNPQSPRPEDEYYCVYQHDVKELNTFYHPYRFWMHDSNESFISTRQTHSNDPVDGTLVYRSGDIYYNTKMRFAGSPFVRSRWGSSFRIQLPRDDPLMGSVEEFNLDNHHGSPSICRERISHYLLRYNSGDIKVPYSLHKMAYLKVNNRYGGILEQVHVPDKEFIQFWFDDDDDGDFFELDDRFEFNDSGGMAGSQNARWTYPPYSGSGADKENYRFFFNLRQDEDEDNYTNLIDTADFMTNSSNAEYDEGIEDHLDVEEILRILSIRLNTDDWDTWGANRGKNSYLYRPEMEGRWHLFAWDMELTYGNPDAFPLPSTPSGNISSNFSEVSRLLNRPRFKRMYYGILKEMVDHHFSSDHLTPYAERLGQIGMTGVDIALSGGFIDQRRDRLIDWIGPVVHPQVKLEITTNNGNPITQASDSVNLAGTAPVEAFTLVVLLNGEPVLPLETGFSNSSMTDWSITGIPLIPGTNNVQVLGYGTFDNLVDFDSIQVNTTVQWSKPRLDEVLPAAALRGDVVELRGADFHVLIQAFFGGQKCKELIFDPANPGHMFAMIPIDAPTGETTVVVRNADNQLSDPVPFTVLESAASFLRGDANGDRSVDIGDAMAILFHLFRGMNFSCRDAMDVDDSGNVEISDVIYLLEYLFLTGNPPRPPFPREGADPTLDGLPCGPS